MKNNWAIEVTSLDFSVSWQTFYFGNESILSLYWQWTAITNWLFVNRSGFFGGDRLATPV